MSRSVSQRVPSVVKGFSRKTSQCCGLRRRPRRALGVTSAVAPAGQRPSAAHDHVRVLEAGHFRDGAARAEQGGMVYVNVHIEFSRERDAAGGPDPPASADRGCRASTARRQRRRAGSAECRPAADQGQRCLAPLPCRPGAAVRPNGELPRTPPASAWQALVPTATTRPLSRTVVMGGRRCGVHLRCGRLQIRRRPCSVVGTSTK